jgi:N-acetyl-gamma-glutamyl-phosphate reductase
LLHKAAVLGVSGYTGQELVQLLYQHPQFKIEALYSTSLQGPLSQDAPQFSAYDLPDVQAFHPEQCDALDILFLAVPHTKAMAIVDQVRQVSSTLKIVDLSADFRLNSTDVYADYYQVDHSASQYLEHAVYGLPEVYKKDLQTALLCANPGCYATSIILGTLPLKNTIPADTPIAIDAKSGVSGAGKGLKASSLFCEVQNSLSAYGTGTHRHMAEFNQEVGFSNVMFSPHLVPMHRGIESAIYLQGVGLSQQELTDLYTDYYADHPFVTVYAPDTTPTTRLVCNTNHCAIIPKKIGEWMVIFSLIDNLGKGASGQAIQNANIMLGLDETTGLI